MTHNADASDPAAVVWNRVDNATSPTRFPSSIYPDPSDTGHAWVTYSGYNATTPTTPGHVFDVTQAGKFTNLNVESGTSAFPSPTGAGDLPVNDIVRDDAKKKLYVATDFGVLRGDNDGKGLARDAGHAAVRGHAPRDRAVGPRRHVRRGRRRRTARP